MILMMRALVSVTSPLLLAGVALGAWRDFAQDRVLLTFAYVKPLSADKETCGLYNEVKSAYSLIGVVFRRYRWLI
jgi:hypothetical protein